MRCDHTNFFRSRTERLGSKSDKVLQKTGHGIERLFVTHNQSAVEVHATESEGDTAEEPVLGLEHLVRYECGECAGKELLLPAHVVEVIHEGAVLLSYLLLYVALVYLLPPLRRSMNLLLFLSLFVPECRSVEVLKV